MKRKIVVVEDNRPIREMVTYILEQAGHDVTAESEGEKGLEQVLEQHPDLVILDLDLQGINGFEVLKRLRADEKIAGTKVVAFTAFAMVGDRERLLNAGFDGYIPKPIDPEPFTDEVNEMMCNERA